ncbi:MAG: mechanosensitive ion channel [Methanosarcinales archaeon]|nr:mechanosensitive ion channel [Methanosarcinales archaeon]
MATDILNSSTANSSLKTSIADVGLSITGMHGDTLILAGAILALSILLAMLARYVAVRLCRKAAKTSTQMDDVIAKVAVSQLPPVVILFGIAAALYVAGVSGIYLKYIIVGFLLLGAQTISRGLRHLIDAYPNILDEHIRSTVMQLGSVIIYTVAFIQILNVLEFPIATAIASMGILGIAVAIAIQPTLSSIFAGFLLVVDKPFDVGDQIAVGGENTGIVREIGFRSTKVMTFDNVLVTIPNSEILNRDITNYTRDERKRRNDALRLRLNIGISYESDIEKAREIMVEVAQNSPHLHSGYHAPTALLLNYGDSSLDFELRMWIRMAIDRYVVRDEVLTKIKKRFDEAGIEIPYPRRYLIMDKEDN